ncbi:hypothetical protein HZ326_26279 [Fusarium oxysporum f. sp. albedinis]|nr:hypothetical protein HZ326_26279 [Fusarium oxysporum f. sp. albedinis]
MGSYERRKICRQVRDETPKANHPIERILSWRPEPELAPLDGRATKKITYHNITVTVTLMASRGSHVSVACG